MNTYIHFLKLFDKEFTNKDHDLDTYLTEILNAIAIYNETEALPIRCSDLLSRTDLGSPATIHKNYHVLIKLGYLKHSYSKSDKRLRYIELASKGEHYFRKMADMMKKSVNNCQKGIDKR